MKRDHQFVYERLYKALKEQILAGLLGPGDYLHTEEELCKQYQMSRNSVRRALDKLLNEGLIVKKGGVGTMVPENLVIPIDGKQLRILVPFPAYFVDYGFPIIIDAFRRKYPDIHVHVLSLPYSNFPKSLQQAEQMGIYPDLVLTTHQHLQQLSTTLGATALGDELHAHLVTMYPKLVKAFYHLGELMAAPIIFSPICLTYNPDLFSRYGISPPSLNWKLQDVMTVAQQFITTVNGQSNSQVGFTFSPDPSHWLVFALQNGFRPNHAENLNIMTRTLATLQNMLHDRSAVLLHNETNKLHPFLCGKSAMSLSSLFNLSEWQKQSPEIQTRVAPITFGEAASTLILANALIVPSTCSNRQLALSFIETSLTEEVQTEISRRTSFLSVHQNINETLHIPEYLRNLNVLGHSMENNYFQRELISIESAEIRNRMELFWLGLEDAATTAAKLIV